MKEKTPFACLLVLLPLCLGAALPPAPAADPYLEVVQKEGQEPVKFVRESLASHDLIIFDDSVHSAREPFDFYQTLLKDPAIQKKIRFVFIEVFGLDAQPHLDAYFAAPVRNNDLLLKVFQEDYSGYGWRYQTYLDLLATVWEINSKLPGPERLQVVGVSPPIYWEAIHTRQEYDIFQDSLVARDYFMYRVILEKLDSFQSGKKGVFLTNTRHAYKHLRNTEGKLLWNCATFFDQWNAGKTLSVRMHHVVLSIQAVAKDMGKRTAEGLEAVEYKWVRVDDGAWDEAFRKAGNHPVAVPLRDNIFGRAKYVGNQMLYAAKDQTMADVHDAVIFLAPLEELHFSAQFNFIFTPQFRIELKRRIQLLEGDRLPEFLKENGSSTLDEFIEVLSAGEPQKPNTLLGRP